MSEYACGCIRNKVVCPVAVYLWDVVADAHKALVHTDTPSALTDYTDALAQYEAHFTGPLVNQKAML